MRKLLLPVTLALLCAIGACNKSSPSAPAPVVTTPTTTLPPSFSGSYSGIMLFNVAGQAEIRAGGATTITQTGNNLDFTPLAIAPPGGAPISLPLGRATLTGNTFTGTHSYNSAGCGVGRVTTQGHFAGRLMNLSAVFNFDSCAQSRTVGELSRP